MKKILLILSILALIVLVGCKPKITNFKECAAAGNPVMESYPRMCRADGQTFIEIIAEPVGPPIGGERDEHGCLGPAGYTWNAKIGACIREWEFNENQRAAAKVAVDSVGKEKGLTVVEVLVAKCPGCFTVKLSDINYKSKTVTLSNWEVVKGKSEVQVFFPEECEAKGGRAVSTVGGFDCEPGEVNIGEVHGFISPHICCVYR